MNPEIKVLYREENHYAKEIFELKYKENPNKVGTFRNRYSKEQFTLTATFSLNSHSKTGKSSFLSLEEIRQNID